MILDEIAEHYFVREEPIKGTIDQILKDYVPIVQLTKEGSYQIAPYSEVTPKGPYFAYPNVSRVNDPVRAADKIYRDLGTNAVYGWCFNESRVIELNKRTLEGDLDQHDITERHEIRHRIHGIDDSNPVGNYIMRALDSTARWAHGIYDKIQRYHQKR